MHRVLFVSENLIGDGMAICPALTVWMREHPGWVVDLKTLGDHATVIYRRMGLPLNILTEEVPKNADYDFTFKFDASAAFEICDKKKIHLVHGYADLLSVTVKDEPIVFNVEEEEHESGLVLVSMFSRSCASHSGLPPNKQLPWHCWPSLLELLRTYGRIAILGGPDDRVPILQIGEEEYFTGIPLNRVALMMRDAALVCTLDNGMAHLACAMDAPMIEFYPKALGLHYMVPWQSAQKRKSAIIHIDPAQTTPAACAFYLRMGIDTLAQRGLIKTHLFSEK